MIPPLSGHFTNANSNEKVFAFNALNDNIALREVAAA
jgi:hypothetical protein